MLLLYNQIKLYLREPVKKNSGKFHTRAKVWGKKFKKKN